LSDVRAHAWCRGEGEVAAWVDLDAPLDDRAFGRTIADVLGADGIEDVYFWFALDELERSLDDVGRAVLGELLDPGAATLKAVRRLWRARLGRPGNWWAKGRVTAIGRGLALPAGKTRAALVRVRRAAKDVFLSGESPLPRSRGVWGGDGSRTLTKEGAVGDPNEKIGLLPDDMEIGLPETQKPAVVQAAAKAAQKKTAAGAPAAAKKGADVKKKKKTAGKKGGKAKTAKAKTAKANGSRKKGVSKTDGVFIVAAKEAGGEFRSKIFSMASSRISYRDLLKKAEAANIPTPGWKINDMLKRGQLKTVAGK
jgi:hypothetical protein